MSVFSEMWAMVEKDSAEKAIREAIRQFGLGISGPCGEQYDEIIKKNVIGYAVVQKTHSNNSKSIQTVPIIERGDINYNPQIPENATVIGILPVTKPTVAVFGGIPDDNVTVRTLQGSMFLLFKEYVLLGFETENREYDERVWKAQLTELWTEKLLKNYNAKLEMI